MSFIVKASRFAAAGALALASGCIAAPVRVVIFNTCGPNSFVHSIAQQTPQLKKMLLNPAAANLQNPVIPPDGFTVDSIGPAKNGGTEDGHSLILALPTHDVVVCANNTDFSKLFSTTDQNVFQAWIAKKGHGVVAFHGASDDNGVWPWKFTFFGAKFTGHTSGLASVYADTTQGNAANADFQALNAGMSKVLTVNDEWYSFQSQPRDLPGIHVLSTLDEATYNPANRMGDHPISWFRTPADSGRFFYTGAGHDWTAFRDTYWLRRQVYNAIVWASGYSPAATFLARNAGVTQGAFSATAQGSSLSVTLNREGPHRVEIRALDGKRMAVAQGLGAATHVFPGLARNALYAVFVTAGGETSRNLVKVP